jgi:AcrR family transcriptional regulator
MGKRRREETHPRGAVKQLLIATALSLTEERGLEAWTVRDLVAKANVTLSAPNYHFSRNELGALVAGIGFQRLHDAVRQAAGNLVERPTDRLVDGCLAYVSFAIKSPNLYRAMFSARLSEGTASDEDSGEASVLDLHQSKAEVFKLFIEAVRDGQRTGSLRSGKADDLAKVATSLAHGVALEFIDEGLGKRIDRLKYARKLFGLMLSGLVTSQQ